LCSVCSCLYALLGLIQGCLSCGAWLQAAGAADTAIELCILIKRAEVLWEGIYPRYLARKQQGILLERLLPHILASKLPSFPPEVMQAYTDCILISSLHHIDLFDTKEQCPVALQQTAHPTQPATVAEYALAVCLGRVFACTAC